MTKDEIVEKATGFQSMERAAAVLDVVARHAGAGCRLADVVRDTDLGKATAHRFLRALEGLGMIELDEISGAYFIGIRIAALASAAADRFGVARRSQPHLERLAKLTSDTIYLSLRVGHEALCVAREEGNYPIKALTLDVGDRRPLGISAASLALLAFLPDEQIESEIASSTESIETFGVDGATLRGMVAKSRELGYALNDGRIVAGVSAIAMPIRTSNGMPIASIAVSAVSSRLTVERQAIIAGWLREEIGEIERELVALLSTSYVGSRRFLNSRRP